MHDSDDWRQVRLTSQTCVKYQNVWHKNLAFFSNLVFVIVLYVETVSFGSVKIAYLLLFFCLFSIDTLKKQLFWTILQSCANSRQSLSLQ